MQDSRYTIQDGKGGANGKRALNWRLLRGKTPRNDAKILINPPLKRRSSKRTNEISGRFSNLYL